MHLLKTSLQNRLLIGIGAMLVPLVALGVGAFVSLESAVNAFEETAEEVNKEMLPLTRLQTQIVQASIPTNDYLTHADSADRDRFLHLSHEIDNTFANALFSATFHLPQEQALLRRAQNEWQQARTTSEAIFARPYPVGSESVAQEMKRLDDHTNRAVEIISSIYDKVRREISKDLDLGHALQRTGLLIIATVFGLELGTVLVVSFVLARSILLPLSILKEGIARFGEGDLSHRISLTTQDELEELAMTFNLMASKLEQSQAELKDLASIDGLTGVYNRREFQQQLKAEVERSRRYGRSCSLLMVDIDHFKSVNDTYGHQAGDEALRATAALIKREVRSGERVARYGGEEFAVILPETSGSSAAAMAERLRDVIATQAIPITQGQTLNLTVSVGTATFPEDAWSPDTLIFAADQALYAAKHAGRNRVCQFVRQVMAQELAAMLVPLPSNEVARLNALYNYNILDTPPEEVFDDLTRLVAHICDTPTALINFVDSTRVWFKSQVGLEAKEISRDVSFCAHAILQPDLFIVQDACQDSRFANNPLVTSDPKIRFYAGAPLITSEGYLIGTLCAIDYVPRELSPAQAEALQTLAHQVVAQLESQRKLAELQVVAGVAAPTRTTKQTQL